jgi:dihydropteroate synthase
MQSINCKGIIINLEKPIVMGIINATPDSFYKGNLNDGMESIVALATKMITDGATILDIGGQSTKPNAEPISIQEEMDRVIPVLEAVHKKHPTTIISVDTFNSTVAIAAVNAGVSIVNDVSCGDMDAAMIPTVASMQNVAYIGMHMRGTPATMQKLTNYDNEIEDIKNYLAEKKAICIAAGIKDFIIDPGFGFAKTVDQNFKLIKNLKSFQDLNCPVLIGVSRKSSIYKTLGITVAEALNGTTVLNTLAIQNGANILRVHDVKEAMEVIKLMEVYKQV